MSLSPKRKTPNPCQGKGLHGQFSVILQLLTETLSFFSNANFHVPLSSVMEARVLDDKGKGLVDWKEVRKRQRAGLQIWNPAL